MDGWRTLIPGPPRWTVDWAAVEEALGPLAQAMARTPQEPCFHGEGDVWTHTGLVCRALTELPAFRALEERSRAALFLAALLHDAGKPRTTRREDGRWVSPRHAAVGAGLAREFLWLELGLSGTAEAQELRETVCLLIRRHTAPLHILDDPEGPRQLRTIAANGELCPLFRLELLCLLAQADVLGRVCGDRERLLEQVALCAELARESGCWEGPFPFPTAYTRFAYLSGRNVPPEVPLYDDTWGPVLLLAGLPGTGKDTWVRTHCPELPVLSLDELRRELGVPPTAPQTPVVEAARSRARQLLRQRQPFVWNATDITPQVRQHQLQLFSGYGAAVRIVYLETAWQEQLRRNRERPDAVPEAAIRRMLERLSPPEPREARQVEWRIV